MKKIILCIVMALFLAGALPASAQLTTTAKDNEAIGPTNDRHVVEVAPEMFYLHYKEPGLMKNAGMMYGLGLDYHYRNAVMLGLENRFAFGEVDYDSHETGSSNNNEDVLFETRAVAGLDARGEEFALVPFVGFGYRYLYDDSSGSQTTTGAGGYQRESNYFYSPVGMKLEIYPDENWTLDLKGEYDIFWRGYQRSVLGDVLAGHPTVHNDQEIFEGYGFKITAGIARQIKSMTVRLGVFYHYWRIGRSENDAVVYNGTNVTYYEPKNRTQEIGGRLSFLF